MPAKLRHVTLAVADMEKTAAFYEQTFGMERVRQSPVAIMLSDGVVSLAIIDGLKNPNIGEDGLGLHHFGFLVDSVEDSGNAVEENGGRYLGQIKGIGAGRDHERKFRDPDGVPFDVVDAEHARTVWRIPG